MFSVYCSSLCHCRFSVTVELKPMFHIKSNVHYINEYIIYDIITTLTKVGTKHCMY